MKQCSKCKEWKDEVEFSKSKSQCKNCIAERVRKYRQTEHGKQVTRLYNKSTARKISYQRYNTSDKARNSSKKYTNSEKGKDNIKKFWENNPDKLKAGNAIRSAVRKGKIPKVTTLNCFHCPNQATNYHHHKGYSKENRFDVIPLCSKCHRVADKSTRQSSH